jgi:hypothetical protein
VASVLLLLHMLAILESSVKILSRRHGGLGVKGPSILRWVNALWVSWDASQAMFSMSSGPMFARRSDIGDQPWRACALLAVLFTLVYQREPEQARVAVSP